MEALINSIGGYDSWQFAALSMGTVVVGVGLRIWKWYLFPIPSFGILLLAFYINHAVSLLPSNTDSIVLGLAGTLPFLFAVMSGLVLFDTDVVRRMFSGKTNNGDASR